MPNKSVAKTAADPLRRPSELALKFAEDIKFGQTSLVDLAESRPFERCGVPKKNIEMWLLKQLQEHEALHQPRPGSYFVQREIARTLAR